MKFHRIHHEDDHHAVINVTPLIDVVMCLIIFYLLVGKLAMDQRTRMTLPSSGAGINQIEPSVLTIEVPTDPELGDARLDGKTMSIAELKAALEKRVGLKKNLAVQLRADRTAPFSRVQPVLDACRDSGLSTVRLATMRVSEDAG